MKNIELDSIIHAPNRLHICAILAPLEEAEFAILREDLGVSESVLSKHIAQLQKADYVSIRQGAINGRARKWAALTPKGRKAFVSHINALKILANL